MLKFKHSKKEVHLETSGTFVEILSDVCLMIGVLHKNMHDDDEEMAADFKLALVEALNDPECPAWKVELVPQGGNVKIAPGLGALLQELARRKKEAEDQ